MKENKIISTIFWRSFFIQTLWNFERMQNVGFAYGLLPLLRSLYRDEEKRKDAMMRHLGFFNVHPYMATLILGIVAAMEKDIANGSARDTNEITVIKNNMAGPLAAIGDTFFWATWRPFTALLGASLILFFHNSNSFAGTLLAPLFFVVVYNCVHLPFRYWALKVSHQLRTRMVRTIAGLEFQRAINIIRYTGLFTLALIFAYYLFYFGANFLDATIFCMVFVGAVLLGYLRLPPSLLLYGTVLLCIGFAWLGIF